MAVFRVLTNPHVLLRKKAAPVLNFTPDLVEFTQSMIETMNAFDGIGLAAPQVGISRRILVVDVAPYFENESVKEWHGSFSVTVDNAPVEKPFPLVLINPELTTSEGEVLFPLDGCLSFPGGPGSTTRRMRRVVVAARDAQNRRVQVSAEGILSICLQHEIDHLDGILFTDRLDDPSDASSILSDVQKYENAAEYRKKLKKLHPVDAREQKYAFL